MLTSNPFNDLCDLVAQFPGPVSSDNTSGKAPVQTMNAAAIVADILPWLAGWQGRGAPSLAESHICVFSSAYEGFDAAAALSFAEDAGRGNTPVNKLCRDQGIGLRVLEMAPSVPHRVSEDWADRDCMAAVAFGMEASAAEGDLLGLAAVAPGCEEASRAFFEQLVAEFGWPGNASAAGEEDRDRQIGVLDLMRAHAGREVAAILGAMIAARSRRLPVMIEGWSALAALLVLKQLRPDASDHVCLAAVENGDYRETASAMGLVPIIGPDVGLGAGCGVAMAVSAIAPLLNLAK